MKNANIISAQDLYDLVSKQLSENTIIIDVRTPAEYRSEKIEGSMNFPLDSIDSCADTIKIYKKIYIVCSTQNRAIKACEVLKEQGCNDVIVVLGGISSWKNKNYPLIEGKKIISLSRQVQISAGGLIVLAVILSLLIHINFVYLSGIISLGLLYTGLSGTCYAAMVLSKMPWNK